MRLRLRTLLPSLAVVAFTTPLAFAQTTIEQNSPPQIEGQQLLKLPNSGDLDAAETNDEPLGINIIGVKVLSNPDELRSAAFAIGINTDNIDPPNGVDLSGALAPYIGKPMSFKLLFEMRDEIVRAYRSAGHAFVAAIIPPQEISGGVVQIIVSESILEAKKVEGTVFSPDDYILDNIAAEDGDTIDTNELISDLNWLNLNPYRNLVVVAEPGKEFAHTILTFRANEQKPWSVYGGYNNNGTSATDENRVFVGFHTANLPILDHQLSYQLTTSPNGLSKINQSLTASNQAAYVSHDGYYFIPLSWKHKLRFRGAYIQTRSDLTGNLVSDSDTTIFSGEYAIPINSFGSVHPELYGRYEYKNSVRDIYSTGTLASHAEIDVHQFLLGLRGNASDQYGRTNFDFRIAHNPGGVSAFNNALSYAAYSGNTNAVARYTYSYAHLQRSTPLADAINLITDLSAQWSNDVLPSTESFGIGGADTVRGYATSETSGEQGFVMRNELHFDVSQKMAVGDNPFLTGLDLFAFTDLGYVRDLGTNSSPNLSSIGVGFNATLGKQVSFNTNVGLALSGAGTTNAGDVRINFNLNARF